MRQVYPAAKIGQKDGGHTSLTIVINDNSEQQVRNPKQISENIEESIIQLTRKKGSEGKINHKQKGGDKSIRQNRRKMKDSKKCKKVARKGETW